MNNVYILGTIHGAHQTNPFYGLHHILEKVQSFSTEILCLEIRAQDMTETNSYLRAYYPPEMVLLKGNYEDQISVFGFDWRGKERENIRIGDRPSDFKDIFQLMREDAFVYNLMMQKKAHMNSFFASCTLESCQLDYLNHYEKIKPLEYQLDQYLCEHGLKELVEYDIERDKKINQNLKEIISENHTKRIMIITGISHKSKIEAYLYQKCKEK
jgi:hypothetical protein